MDDESDDDADKKKHRSLFIPKNNMKNVFFGFYSSDEDDSDSDSDDSSGDEG